MTDDQIREKLRKLEKYELVNAAESAEELKAAIVALSDENGIIQGRSGEMDSIKMVDAVDLVINHKFTANSLTREFGIRQQALYIREYKKAVEAYNEILKSIGFNSGFSKFMSENLEDIK